MPEQTTLRGALAAAFDNAESGAIESTADTTVDTTTETTAEQRARDEQGRFSRQAGDVADVQARPTITAPAQPAEDAIERPTTWKKEYMPMWEKLHSGAQLTPEEAKAFLKYQNQRESEYKTGVSTYKQEAERARELHGVLEPFMPLLQQYNQSPAQWIQNLGNAHRVMVTGSPEQKAQMFVKMATNYGVDLASLTGGGGDVQTGALLGKIKELEGTINSISSWKKQQDDTQVSSVLNEFQDAAKYPHFEKVRVTMAQLLESGFTNDPKKAYDKAVRLDDEVWTQEQARQSQAHSAQETQRQAVAKAKANAVSVKTATPSTVIAGDKAKDRRAVLTEQLEAHSGRV